MSHRYRSKIDAWLGAVLVLSIGAALFAAAMLLRSPMAWRWLVLVVMLGVGVALPLWLLAGTYYSIEGHELVVRGGPFRWRIPLSEIVAIEPTRSPLSSPALSLDRLLIRRRGGEECMVSPSDKEAFRKELREHGVKVA